MTTPLPLPPPPPDPSLNPSVVDSVHHRDRRHRIIRPSSSSPPLGKEMDRDLHPGEDAWDMSSFFHDESRPITWARIRGVSNRFEEVKREKLEVSCRYFKKKLWICRRRSQLKVAQEKGNGDETRTVGDILKGLQRSVRKFVRQRIQLSTRCTAIQGVLIRLLQGFNYSRVISITCPGDVVALKRARSWAVVKPNPGPPKIVRYRLGLSAKRELLEEIHREAGRSQIQLPQPCADDAEVSEIMEMKVV